MVEVPDESEPRKGRRTSRAHYRGRERAVPRQGFRRHWRRRHHEGSRPDPRRLLWPFFVKRRFGRAVQQTNDGTGGGKLVENHGIRPESAVSRTARSLPLIAASRRPGPWLWVRGAW